MSAPLSRRCVAKECRNVCGVTRLPRLARDEVFAEDESDAPVRDPPAPLVDEYRVRAVRRGACRGRVRCAAAHVLAQRDDRGCSQEHVALLGPFSHDPGAGALQVDVLEVQGHELRDAAARGVQGFQHGPVTELPERVLPGAGSSADGSSMSRAISSSKRNEGRRFSVRRLRISANGFAPISPRRSM